MGIRSFINRFRPGASTPPSSSSALGPVYVTPSEAQTSTAGATAAGTPVQVVSSSGGGGGGGGGGGSSGAVQQAVASTGGGTVSAPAGGTTVSTPASTATSTGLSQKTLATVVQATTQRKDIIKAGASKLATKFTSSEARQEFLEKKEQRRLLEEQRRKQEESSTFKELYQQGNLPGIVRKGSREAGNVFTQKVTTPLLTRTTGKEPSPQAQEAGAKVFGETLLFGAFQPGFTTTSQIQTTLGTQTDVGLVGVTARKGKVDQTVVGFATKSGKTETVGAAVGAGTRTSENIIVSVSRAGRIRTGVKLPSGKPVTKVKDITDSVSASIIEQKGGSSFQFGLTKTGTKDTTRSLDLFQIKNIGDDLIGVRGVSVGETGRVNVEGLIKKVGKEGGSSSFQGGVGTIIQTPKATVKSVVESVTKQVQKQSLGKAVKTSRETGFITPSAEISSPKVESKIISGSTVTTQTIQPETKSVPKDILFIPTTKTDQVSRGRTSSASRTNQQQELSQATSQEQFPIQVQPQIPVQSQKPQLNVIQISRLKQPSRSEQGLIAPRVRTPTQKKKPIGFRRRKGKAPSMSNFLFGAEVRRKGKFRSIGTFGSVNEAISAGREKVSGTLAASFRVTAPKGKSVKIQTPTGFYRKGSVVIEKPKFRLSKKGEKVEIQKAKKRRKRK